MKKVNFILIAILGLVILCCQNDGGSIFSPLPKIALSNTQEGTKSAFRGLEQATEPTCAQTPTQADINNGPWSYSDRFYSLSEALSAGIPIVRGSLSRKFKVIVRDYKRAKKCHAINSDTVLEYGQVIRSVIEIQNFDASVGIDLASIAANGTLNKAQQNFYLYKDGFYNSEIDTIIASVSGKVFNVENYALYNSVMTQMIGLLSRPETQFSAGVIGTITDNKDDKFLREAPIVSYTLSQILKGKNCEEIKAFFTTNQEATLTVESVFSTLKLNCDISIPSEEIKRRAKEYLQGIKIR